jgi:hypothetical protein
VRQRRGYISLYQFISSMVNFYFLRHLACTALLSVGGTLAGHAQTVTNDAAVATVYTYGKLATPASPGHAVQAVVSNNGTAALTNLPVTLAVTGANPFTNVQTVASLAPGASATVTFAAYPATLATGTNSLLVSVPADGNNGNNTYAYTQQINATRVAYANPAQAYEPAGVYMPTADIMVAKYSLATATNYLGEVVATFPAPTNTGASAPPFLVVVYDATGPGGTPGNLLYTSPTPVIPFTNNGSTITVPVALPAVPVGSTFYLGLKGNGACPALSYQASYPARPNTYYYQNSKIGAWSATTKPEQWGLEFGLTTAPACPIPTNFSVGTVTATSAAVTFTGPSNGTSCTVSYGLPGSPPVTRPVVTGTASPIILTGLIPNTTYEVCIQATCGTSGQSTQICLPSFTTSCLAVTAFPYSESFDGVTAPALPCGITVLDANADNIGWTNESNTANSTPNAMRYRYSALNAADDWFFTPALFLQTGLSYQLSFKYRTNSASYVEALEVKAGSAATAAGQTTTLFSNTNISNATYTTTTAGNGAGQVARFTPTTSGMYYMGFHAISVANQLYLYVDDIVLTAATITATKSSTAPSFSAEASPVPFGENLTLKLITLQAGPLQLTLHDQVGRVVRQHSTTVPAGASTLAVPEVGSLPAGMYLLTMRQSGNTQIIRVAHE